MECRKQNRHRLGVPVTFSWRDVRRAQQEGVGLTRDLSLAAAFVATAPPAPLEANIKVFLTARCDKS